MPLAPTGETTFALPAPDNASEPDAASERPRSPDVVIEADYDMGELTGAAPLVAEEEREEARGREVRTGSGPPQGDYTQDGIGHLLSVWTGSAHSESPACVRCGAIVVSGARYCEACGADQYEEHNDPHLQAEARDNIRDVTA